MIVLNCSSCLSNLSEEMIVKIRKQTHLDQTGNCSGKIIDFTQKYKSYLITKSYLY